jgi:hypothetical protein
MVTSKLKSQNSNRHIPIPPELERELRRWRMQTVNSKFVFPTDTGNPQNPSNVTAITQLILDPDKAFESTHHMLSSV